MAEQRERKVEIFSIGDELLLGRIADTNSSWLAQRVSRLGMRVRRITILGDDIDVMQRCLDEAIARGPDYILLSGGLGPTQDDLTVEMLARLTGGTVAPHEPTLEHFCLRRNVSRDQLNPGQLKMGSVPTTATVLPNPFGWAPGLMLDKNGTRFFAMPGPPKEVEAVFNEHIEPRLAAAGGRRSAARRVLIGMFESQMAPLLERVMREAPACYVKAYVAMRTDEGLPVDIVAYADSSAECEAELDRAFTLLAGLAVEQGAKVEPL